MLRKVFLSVLCLAMLGCGAAQAQRLVPGQWQFSFGGQGWYHIPMGDCRNPTLIGGELSFDRINYNNKLVIRVNGNTSVMYGYEIADNQEAGWSAGIADIRHVDFFASYGYLWNIARSRSRGVNLWGGGTVDAGARLRRMLVKPDLPVYGIPAVSFLPGVSPELNLEVFMGDHASLSFFIRAHMQFPVITKNYLGNSSEPWFLPMAGIQFNFNFFLDR